MQEADENSYGSSASCKKTLMTWEWCFFFFFFLLQTFLHFWLARGSRPCEHQHTDAWKYANHNNIAIEPQLILCYEDFKDRHLPDIHTKGINGKEKCKDSNEKKKKKLTWRESGHLFFVLHVFFFYKTVFDRNILLIVFNPNLGIFGGVFSNFVCQLKMAVYGLIIIIGIWNLSHKQVNGSETESNVTFKVTCVGCFSWYVTVTLTAIQLSVLLSSCDTKCTSSLAWMTDRIGLGPPCGHQTCLLFNFLIFCIKNERFYDNQKINKSWEQLLN